MTNNNQEVRKNNLEVRKNNNVTLNGGVFSNIEQFEAAQRMAMALQQSNMVPAAFKNDMGACLIALDMSSRLKMNVLAIMQNMYVIHGKPAWSSQFVISGINQSGLFGSSLNFEFVGNEGTDTYGCYAWALDKNTKEKIKGTTITIKMAKDEGWYGKAGSKWRTMPEQMLRYRSASFFGRTYAPDITMGIYTKDEVEEMGDDYQILDTDQEFEEEKKKEANSQVLDVEFEKVKEAPANVNTKTGEIIEEEAAETIEGQSDFFTPDFQEIEEAPF